MISEWGLAWGVGGVGQASPEAVARMLTKCVRGHSQAWKRVAPGTCSFALCPVCDTLLPSAPDTQDSSGQRFSTSPMSVPLKTPRGTGV